MKICPNCDKPFTEGQVFRSKWLGYYKLKCSNCNAQYEHQFKDRLTMAIIPALSFVVAGLIMKFNNFKFSYYIILAIILGFILAVFVSRGFKYERIK